MTAGALAAVAVGAVLGAWLRWALGIRFNGVLAHLPLGTLIANAVGGYLVGIAVAWFAQHPDASLELRLFVVTGFLGALTTFSTFSAEAVGLLMRQQYGWAIVHVSAHLGVSVLLTILGILTVKTLRA